MSFRKLLLLLSASYFVTFTSAFAKQQNVKSPLGLPLSEKKDTKLLQSSTSMPEDEFTRLWLISTIRREELALRDSLILFKYQMDAFFNKARKQQLKHMSLLASQCHAFASAVLKVIWSFCFLLKHLLLKLLGMYISSDTGTSLFLSTKKRHIKAREQPKIPTEEEKLQVKYASIDSVEDRAFQILLDLGMIQETK